MTFSTQPITSILIGLGLIFLPSCKETAQPTHETETKEAIPPQAIENGFSQKLKEELNRIDPKVDGWDTEVFESMAGKRLKTLGVSLTQKTANGNRNFENLFTPNAQSTLLRPLPSDLTVAYHQNGFRVLEDQNAPSDSSRQKSLTTRPTKALDSLGKILDEFEHPHSKFKIYRVHPSEFSISTKVIVLLDGHKQEGESVQINTEWNVKWTRDELPLIQSIERIRYQEIRSQASSSRLFLDCTESLLPQEEVRDQLSRGLPHWIRSVDKDLGVSTNGYNGLSIGDLNGDGLDDLYFCQTGGIPNRILLQSTDGRLLDHSEESRANFLNDTRTVLIIDLDQDDDNDLVLNIPNGIVFMENDGTARFTKRFEIKAKGAPFGMAAADPDNDGFLDIFVCGYGSVWGGLGDYKHHIPLPMHDANNGGENLFLRNLGDWNFEDQTTQSGFHHNNTRWSLSAAWADYDLDGDLDLYVANDFGRNNLYENVSDEGSLKFRDVAPQTGSEDLSPSMSASWGDPNNDGFPDIHVSNMFSGAGNRITTQSQFMTEATSETRDHFLRMSRGNTLLSGRSGGFDDISEDAGITLGRWAWASRMVDINNDGWEDILVANGFMTGEDPADL